MDFKIFWGEFLLFFLIFTKGIKAKLNELESESDIFPQNKGQSCQIWYQFFTDDNWEQFFKKAQDLEIDCGFCSVSLLPAQSLKIKKSK